MSVPAFARSAARQKNRDYDVADGPSSRYSSAFPDATRQRFHKASVVKNLRRRATQSHKQAMTAFTARLRHLTVPPISFEWILARDQSLINMHRQRRTQSRH